MFIAMLNFQRVSNHENENVPDLDVRAMLNFDKWLVTEWQPNYIAVRRD